MDRRPPLDGVIVADFSRVLAGPYVTMTLADLGATVIKVERPRTGDETRSWGPPWSSAATSTYFECANRNKRSIELDLACDDDLALAHRLVGRADVLVENFRPGSLDRYRLDPAATTETHPRLVHCSITGFGRDPAAGGLPGYDLVVQATSGLMSITGPPDGPPTKVGVAVVDQLCALQALVGILAALRERERSGRGQVVSVNLLQAALAALANQASGYLGAGIVPERAGNRHPSIAPYQVFSTGDGDVVIACGNDGQFRRAMEALGLASIGTDPRFATNTDRVERVDELDELISAGLAGWSSGAVVEVLGQAAVPASPILDVAEAINFAEGLGLDPIDSHNREGAGTFRSIRSPIGLSATPCETRRPPPALGQHGPELRRWLENEHT